MPSITAHFIPISYLSHTYLTPVSYLSHTYPIAKALIIIEDIPLLTRLVLILIGITDI